jgi:hypothetical protein
LRPPTIAELVGYLRPRLYGALFHDAWVKEFEEGPLLHLARLPHELRMETLRHLSA